MTNKPLRAAEMVGGIFSVTFSIAMTGCLAAPPHREFGARRPAPVQHVEVVVQDDYVYYPGYEVYYSSNRRQYMYRNGNAWVTQAAPPQVSMAVLQASPSVRLDFHDAPARHHESVVQTYPRNWSPPANAHAAKSKAQDERKADQKNEREEDRKEHN
jgi:hypothetical protein